MEAHALMSIQFADTLNYYFKTVHSLEDAIIRAIHNLSRRLDHPFRLQLKTVQPFSTAA